MSKMIAQEVYFNTTEEINISKTIYKLGIQGIPGTVFKINKGDNCILGVTGIFDFDFEGLTPIWNITIPGGENLASYNNNRKLIIDYIYEEEGGSNQ